jgi:hypothetical protein
MGSDTALTPDQVRDALRLYAHVNPSAVYMRIDDNIRITSYNSLASVRLEVRSRILGCEGNIIASGDVQVPNSDRTAKQSIFITPEGWLLGLEIFASAASPFRGQTYVVVEIVRGLGSSATVLQTLAMGYLTAKEPLAYPGSPLQSSIEGRGWMRSFTGTNPAAGAESTETVPTGARWRLVGHFITLTTSATAATREFGLIIDDGVNTMLGSGPQIGQITTLVRAYNGFLSNQRAALGAGVLLPYPIPEAICLAGWRIRTSTVAIQVGDDYTAPQLLVEEWLEVA